jgi:hypothetical protein
MERSGPGGAGSRAVTEAAHADLVAEIARTLQQAGFYHVTLDAWPSQRLVDLRWAALSAGRLLGRRVRVVSSRAVNADEGPITVRVTCLPEIPRMRDRLED